MPWTETVVSSVCCSLTVVFLEMIGWPTLLEVISHSRDKQLNEWVLTKGEYKDQAVRAEAVGGLSPPLQR